MKNIAFVTKYPFHIECVGFLLELLESNTITVYYTEDNFNYLSYFEKIYSFKKDFLKNFNEIKYDIIIKLSANDNGIKLINKKKTLGILHLGEPEQNFEKIDINNFITLSPYVKSQNANILKYILPIYRGLSHSNNINNNIIYIGMFQPILLNFELEKFIKNINYKVIFIGGAPKEVIHLSNVISLPKLKTQEMISLLCKSKFVLCRNLSFFNDRFTGAISLALSHNIPLIMEKKMSDDYNIPSFNYNKNYSEITNLINNLTDEDYNNHKVLLKKFTNFMLDNNKIIMDDIIKNII